MDKRRCRVCGELKPLEDFYLRSRPRANGRRVKPPSNTCKVCFQARDKAKKYKVPKGYKAPKRCPLCQRRFNKSRKPHHDHNHATGKFRSMLCGSCNGMLGLARDDPKVLKRAVKYLEKHEQT